jgi:uncharacterized membrane protein YdjX (TVP38/TMEM64 family)
MRRRVILAGLALAAVAALLFLAPWREALAAFAGWARAAGPAGVAAFAIAYAAGSVMALPVWPLTVVAGVAYGAWLGFAVALPAGALGASLALLVGRTVLRGAVARRVARDPRLAAMDEAVSRQGAVLVLLLRLSPLAPYNVVNYALSASRIGLLPFAGASLVGMAPITFAWAWAGATFGGLKGLSNRPAAGPAERALQLAGLVATVIVVLVLGRMARRALRSTVPSARQDGPASPTPGGPA